MSCEDLGRTRMLEAINSGEELSKVLNSLLANPRANALMLVGAASALVGCHCAGREILTDGTACTTGPEAAFLGGSVKSIDFELSKALNEGDFSLFARYLSALVGSVANIKRATNCHFEIPMCAVPVQAVQIVGMPDRRVTTEFERDPETMEIVRSKQVESFSAA